MIQFLMVYVDDNNAMIVSSNFVKYYNVSNENYIILISKAHCCPDDINSRYIWFDVRK